MTKFPKQAAGYFHILNCGYTCGECSLFIDNTFKCLIHGIGDVIMPYGSCNLFTPGKPAKNATPRGELNKIQTGYIENAGKYSCKNCDEFLQVLSRCEKVDDKSLGDDLERIHPDACCNRFEPKGKDLY